MKFSILITTFNRLPMLKRAVESALSQTVPCEVIVADDGSTDGTEAYIQTLGDRIVYCQNPRNLGHSATINAGVAVATGDWIKLVDDDDYLAPDCVETMIQGITLCPEAVICSCQAIQVDVGQQEVSCTAKTGPGQIFYIPQEDIHYGMLLEQVPFGTPIQVAFRRDVFLKSGGWDSSLDINCDDIDCWIKLAQFGDAVFINRTLTYRTIWPGARNQKIPYEKRLTTNFLMKQKIHSLVHEKYRANLPTLEQLQGYLHLYWSMVALKHRDLWMAITIGLPVLFSYSAWKMLIRVIVSRYQPTQGSPIHKLMLLE